MVDDKSIKAPLKNPQVDVRAEPDWDNDPDPDWDYIDKVTESVENDVRRALEKSEGNGAGAQIGAANDAVDDAGSQVDPSKVDKIHVEIDDEDGRHVEIHNTPSGKNR